MQSPGFILNGLFVYDNFVIRSSECCDHEVTIIHQNLMGVCQLDLGCYVYVYIDKIYQPLVNKYGSKDSPKYDIKLMFFKESCLWLTDNNFIKSATCNETTNVSILVQMRNSKFKI